ncbi:YcjF family protein [Halomonas cibimaris]|uniref:YcjF family protein n=1 Tax=Halomonas cibimaris TaxID=657012 RepID=A0ABP7LJJ1_9GAMM
MSSPRPRRHFALGGDSVAKPQTQRHDTLRGAYRFDDTAEEKPTPHDTASRDALPEESLGAPRKRRWGLLLTLSGATALGTAELVTGLPDAVSGARWLDAAWQLFGLALVGLGAAAMLGELTRLGRLKRHAKLRSALAALPQRSPRQASELAGRLQSQLNLADDDPHWAAFHAAREPHHSGTETLALLDHHLIAPRDREARRLISRMCGETAVMVAVSPLTLVDMALVAWRNLAMIDRICRLYGLELGYASRLRLFKTVLANMAFAGASELASEAGMDMLSLDMTGRLSARAGQGLSVGLLSARLGLRAMRLCRPLAFAPGQQPRIGDLRRELWHQLRRLDASPQPGEKTPPP